MYLRMNKAIHYDFLDKRTYARNIYVYYVTYVCIVEWVLLKGVREVTMSKAGWSTGTCS